MTDEQNPWSKDVPVAPAPTEFVFAQPEQVAEPGPGTADPEAGTPSVRNDPVLIDTTSRRRWITAGVGLGVVLIGVAAATIVRDTSESADTASETTIAAESTAVEELPGATIAPPSTTPVATSTSGSQQTVLKDLSPPGTWTDGELVIPARLTQFETPTQLLALSARGLVIQIDMLTGATSTLDLDRRQSSAQLHMRDRVALITSNGGSGALSPIIVEQGQPPIRVDMPGAAGGFYIYNDGPTVDDFRAEMFLNANGEAGSIAIGLDGAVSEIDGSSENLFYGRYEMITGERLVFDAGDHFLVSAPGVEPSTARRISTGTLISQSPSSIFVIECSEQRVCGAVLIDVESGDRTGIPDVDGVQFDDRNRQPAVMSPDGSALLLISGQSGTGKFFDLVTGEVTELPIRIAANFPTPKFSWAPDSSGIVALQAGEIAFVDRFTGEVTTLPIEFSDVDAVVDVRARTVPTPPS